MVRGAVRICGVSLRVARVIGVQQLGFGKLFVVLNLVCEPRGSGALKMLRAAQLICQVINKGLLMQLFTKCGTNETAGRATAKALMKLEAQEPPRDESDASLFSIFFPPCHFISEIKTRTLTGLCGVRTIHFA